MENTPTSPLMASVRIQLTSAQNREGVGGHARHSPSPELTPSMDGSETSDPKAEAEVKEGVPEPEPTGEEAESDASSGHTFLWTFFYYNVFY